MKKSQSLPSRKYVRESTEVLTWLMLRSLLQIISVVFVAKLLGATEYGYFVAALATVSLFSPLAGLGLHAVVVRDGSKAPQEIDSLIAASIAIWWKSALVLSVAGALATWLSLPDNRISFGAICIIAAGEIIGTSGIELLARGKQAARKMRVFGALHTGLIAVRLLSIGLFALFKVPVAQDWMFLFGSSSLIYLFFILLRSHHVQKQTKFVDKNLVKEGLPFLTGAMAFRLQTEFSKPVLAHLSLNDTGAFNIAQKAVDIANLPIMALQETMLPRLLSAGTKENLFRMTWIYLSIFSVIIGFLIILGAPIIPEIFGADFGNASRIVQLLAWLPLFQTQRNFANVQVVASGQATKLTGIYLLIAPCTMVTIYAAAQIWGVNGIVYSAYINEALLTMALISTLKNERAA